MPAECGVPVYVRDQGLYKHCPDMPQPNLLLGSIVTWKTRRSSNDNDGEEVALATVSWYKNFFRNNKQALRFVLIMSGSITCLLIDYMLQEHSYRSGFST